MLLLPPRVVAYGMKAAMASNVYMLTQGGKSNTTNGHHPNRQLKFLKTSDFCTRIVTSQLGPQGPLSHLNTILPSLLQPPCPAAASPERVVILITCPLDAVMTGIFSTLGVDMERRTTPLEKWRQASPPKVSEHLHFAMHMSICIIDAKIWNDNSLSFKEKFKAGTFWDHQGNRGIRRRPKEGTAGYAWLDCDIESIEAVELLGTSRLSDDEIKEKIFSPLFQKWSYLPVWWNCQDFAIRLGYLLTKPAKPDPNTNTNTSQAPKQLNNILLELKDLMKHQVIEQRRKWIFVARNFIAISSVGIAFLPLAIPSLTIAVPIGIGGAVTAECMSGLVAGMYHVVDWRRGLMWKKSMKVVEDEFGELEELHEGLDGACEEFTTGRNLVRRFWDLQAVRSVLRLRRLVRSFGSVSGGTLFELEGLRGLSR